MPVPVPVAARGGRRRGGSGLSTTALSVVSTIRAIDAALETADLVTLTGSMMPAATMST